MNKQEIKKAIKELKDYKGDVFKETISRQAVDLAISALEHQLTNGWIPVSERLPKKSGYYLCAADWYGNHYQSLGKGIRTLKTNFECKYISVGETYCYYLDKEITDECNNCKMRSSCVHCLWETDRLRYKECDDCVEVEK